jgi:catechol 2,3-dioxygenase-like lactoylglutathione lyase family enzyme
MTIHCITHIALRVQDLRKAEAFYCHLFDLEVAWREAETLDGWRTLPEGRTWEDAFAAGIHLNLVMLYRDNFALALEAVTEVRAQGALSHLGLYVDEHELALLKQRAITLGCSIVSTSEQTIVFDDQYAVRWEPTVTSYFDPRQFSTGARQGAWLAV